MKTLDKLCAECNTLLRLAGLQAVGKTRNPNGLVNPCVFIGNNRLMMHVFSYCRSHITRICISDPTAPPVKMKDELYRTLHLTSHPEQPMNSCPPTRVDAPPTSLLLTNDCPHFLCRCLKRLQPPHPTHATKPEIERALRESRVPGEQSRQIR
jgi:hypothetical protein